MSVMACCTCRFCGRDDLSARGITAHETHCDDNPNPGIAPSKQEELGLLDDGDDEGMSGGKDTDSTPNPDQRAESDGGLPERTEIPEQLQSAQDGQEADARADGGRECPACDSSDTVPTFKAREGFVSNLSETPDGLKATLNATERYCNACTAVWGGELDDPHRLFPGGGRR